MTQTPRQLVINALTFNYPERLPCDMWVLPWAQARYPKELEKVSGKITFWGEIDRQHILVQKDLGKTKETVDLVADNLYDPAGGIIAQFECGPGIYPPNAEVIFERWDKIHREKKKP